MRAIIYNSGSGLRMGESTINCHKSMIQLANGESIFERQLRILSACCIRDIIVTVGPFKEQLLEVTARTDFKDISFVFVENAKYVETNYIYSMYLAKDYLNSDCISLHGDLVFNEELLRSVIDSDIKSLGLINRKKQLPEKDFKGRIKDGKIQEVSVNIFGENCYALQPLYKLSEADMKKWLDKVTEYIEAGNVKTYAENALNEILPSINMIEFSYEEHYIEEIDNQDDLARVSREIDEYDSAFYRGLKNEAATIF